MAAPKFNAMRDTPTLNMGPLGDRSLVKSS